MQRVGELIDRIEEIRTSLTLDLSSVEMTDMERQLHETTPPYFYNVFRDPLIAGLLEVSRMAWWIGPNKAPDSFWAKTEERMDPAWVGHAEVVRPNGGLLVNRMNTRYPDRDSNMRLPPLPTDTLALLSMPQLGYLSNRPPWQVRRGLRRISRTIQP